MAAAPLSREELVDLCVELTAALLSLGHTAEGTEAVPDSHVRVAGLLRDRVALARTFERIPEEARARLRTVYKSIREEVEEEQGIDGLGDLLEVCGLDASEWRRESADAMAQAAGARLRDPLLARRFAENATIGMESLWP